MTFAIPRLAAYPDWTQLVVERRGFEFLENWPKPRERNSSAHRPSRRLGTRWYGSGRGWSSGQCRNSGRAYARARCLAPKVSRQVSASKTITVGSDKFAFLEIMQALRRNELVAMLGRSTLFEQRVEVKFLISRPCFPRRPRVSGNTRCDYHSGICSAASTGRYGCYAISDRDDHGTGPGGK